MPPSSINTYGTVGFAGITATCAAFGAFAGAEEEVELPLQANSERNAIIAMKGLEFLHDLIMTDSF